jgi:hypothetical protein
VTVVLSIIGGIVFVVFIMWAIVQTVKKDSREHDALHLTTAEVPAEVRLQPHSLR